MPPGSSLERHLSWLDARSRAGEQNAAALWRELKARGFRGCYHVVVVWVTCRLRADAANLEHLKRNAFGAHRGLTHADGARRPFPRSEDAGRRNRGGGARAGRSQGYRGRLPTPWCASGRRPCWTTGLSGPPPACSPPSPLVSQAIAGSCTPPSPRPGRTPRPKGKSPS